MATKRTVEVILIGSEGARTAEVTPRPMVKPPKPVATESLTITHDIKLSKDRAWAKVEAAITGAKTDLQALVKGVDAILDAEPEPEKPRRKTVREYSIESGLRKIAKIRAERLAYEKHHNVAEKRERAMARLAELKSQGRA